jgi:hypothetical protein
MGVKISELSEAVAAQNTDLLPIVQNGETKKIQVETLFANLKTLITNLQTQINTKNIITAGITSSITILNAGANNINFNKIINSVGNELSISNGNIIIGSGINHVLITGQGQMNITTGNGDAKNFEIQKNGTTVISNLNTLVRSYALNVTRGFGGFLLPVSEGDEISYQIYAGVGDVVNATGNYITVEAID